MTALAPSTMSLVPGPSQPPSQASTPASPSANFSTQQAGSATSKSYRTGSPRPGTPNNNGVSAQKYTSFSEAGSQSPLFMSHQRANANQPDIIDEVKSWSDAGVARWLSSLDTAGRCAQHASAFRANDIRGEVILDLDQAILKEMGIHSIGDRIRILNGVKALRIKCQHARFYRDFGQHHPTVARQIQEQMEKAEARQKQGGGANNASTNGVITSVAHPSPKLTLNGTDQVEFPRHGHTSSEDRVQQQVNSAPPAHPPRNRARPAPLQLRHAQQADLPRLIRDPPAPPESARATTPLRPLPQQPSVPVSNSSTPAVGTPQQASAANQHGPRLNLPPLPPAPRSQPPLPPTSNSTSRERQQPRLQALVNQPSTGRRTPTQSEAPQYALPPVPSQSQLQTPVTQQGGLYTPGAGTPGAGNNWKGEYGLPAGPRPGNLGSSRATSPLPGSAASTGGANTPTLNLNMVNPISQLARNANTRSPGAGHGKTPSLSNLKGALTSGLAAALGSRPNTSSGVTSSHPYANAGANSSGGLVAPSASGVILSPIAESFISQHSALPTPSPPTATSSGSIPGSSASGSTSGPGSTPGSSNPNASAYHVGRGPFQRPGTPQHAPAPSLDDLRRKLVRFKLADGNVIGATITVNAAECNDGVDLLERVLKKFGKLGGAGRGGSDSDIDIDTDDGGLTIDGWGVYLDWGQEDGPGKPLRESELLSVCSAGPDHPVREHGLTVRRTGKPKRSKALQAIFGEDPPPTLSGTPSSPRSPVFAAPPTDDGESEVFLSTSSPDKALNMKRASSISVLSGLGVRDPERVLQSAGVNTSNSSNSNLSAQKDQQQPAQKSPSASSFAGKIRTFLGQRPPSELIATHLPAYFPYTQPKVLRHAVRQSMRFSGIHGAGLGRRDSGVSVSQLAAAANVAGPRSRFSSSTAGSRSRTSISPSRASMQSLPPPVPEKSPQKQPSGDAPERSDSDSIVDEPPRMSLSTSDGQSIDLSKETPDSASTTHLLPPVNFPTESFSESLGKFTSGARQGGSPAVSRTASNASRRFSYMTELRNRRDRSDTASMLTVDEITAEVENRRMSMVASVRSQDSTTLADAASVAEMDMTEEPEELDEENYEIVDGEEEEDDQTLQEEEIDEEEVEVEEDDAPVTATGGKRGIKWIRGALIGAGSFGSVYLGMDAMNGLLMAVKQVELPTGSGPNEQRKKSMLDALEREIDLLRDLQHENIVQYLDSSSDDKHLNIFLEYVPGGSVTALLRNYGAFEEALCRHFVRQILQGLNYLHERDIIHRDIKGANILVDNKGGIKISDFGISKKVEDTLISGSRVHRPSMQGSVYWMAPEVVKRTTYTRKADIWSVGCLVVEMLTGEHPWAKLDQMQAIFRLGSSAKPAIPTDISPEATDFLQRTFEIDYDARPTASELLQHDWIIKGPNSSSSTKPSSSKGKVAKA